MNIETLTEIVTRVQLVLMIRPDLLKPIWRGRTNPIVGHCYIATETLYHLLGDVNWKTESLRLDDGKTHWYLRHRKTNEVLDPTAGQFTTPPDYTKGRGRGLLTKHPSARAVEVLRMMALFSTHRESSNGAAASNEG